MDMDTMLVTPRRYLARLKTLKSVERYYADIMRNVDSNLRRAIEEGPLSDDWFSRIRQEAFARLQSMTAVHH